MFAIRLPIQLAGEKLVITLVDQFVGFHNATFDTATENLQALQNFFRLIEAFFKAAANQLDEIPGDLIRVVVGSLGGVGVEKTGR